MSYILSLSKIMAASSLLHTDWSSSGRSSSSHGEELATKAAMRGLMRVFSSISSFSFFTDSRENFKSPSYVVRTRNKRSQEISP